MALALGVTDKSIKRYLKVLRERILFQAAEETGLGALDVIEAGALEGNDPVIVLGQLISALQSIISRNIASDQNAVVSDSREEWDILPSCCR